MKIIAYREFFIFSGLKMCGNFEIFFFFFLSKPKIYFTRYIKTKIKNEIFTILIIGIGLTNGIFFCTQL